jgi:hypothetical protein
MKRVQLKKPKSKGEFARKLLNETDYDQLIEGDTEVRGPDGELLVVLLRDKFSRKELSHAWSILKDVNLKTDNRGTAAGVEMERAVKADGTLSKTRSVPKGYEVTSGVIGYYPRYPRIPFCRECAWNTENPAAFASLLPLFEQVNHLHRKYSSKSWDLQQEAVRKTSQDFVIPGTIYTTITVNKNFRTAAHLDAKNLDAGMAPMLYLRQGQFSGGHVVLPEWRIAAKMDTGDLILFRNMQDYHGNTKIVPLSKDYQRCTLVFYYREEMIKCGTKEQELTRAKSGKDYGVNFND